MANQLGVAYELARVSKNFFRIFLLSYNYIAYVRLITSFLLQFHSFLKNIQYIIYYLQNKPTVKIRSMKYQNGFKNSDIYRIVFNGYFNVSKILLFKIIRQMHRIILNKKNVNDKLKLWSYIFK